MMATLLILAPLWNAFQAGPGLANPGAAVTLMLGAMIVIPVGVLVAMDWLERQIAAKSPGECWPELLLYNNEAEWPGFLDRPHV
jgi:hypothetical protein